MNEYIFTKEWLKNATTIAIIVAGIAAVGAIIAAFVQSNFSATL
ncbi:MAG: hypothetical protein RR573_02875 [Oscillospiraceae bacterium]